MRRTLRAVAALLLLLILLFVSRPPSRVIPPSAYTFKPLSSPGKLNVRQNDLLYMLNGPSETLFLVRGEHGVLYLRNEVYGSYVNGTWLPVNSTWEWRSGMEGGGSGSGSVENVTLISTRQISGNLPVPWHTVGVSVPAYYSPETGLFRPIQPVVMYTVFYTKRTKPNSDRGVEDQRNLSQVYLTVKAEGGENVTRILRELAVNVTKGASTDYQKVQLLADYLRSNYAYGGVSVPGGVDPVYYFLFVSHRGICVDFNAALVVLSRLLGIPARLVTGYLVMPDQNVVTSKNAHAWAQVYIKGRGWLDVDATGGGNRPPAAASNLTLRNVLNRTGTPVNVTVAPKSEDVYVYPSLTQNNSIEPIVVGPKNSTAAGIKRPGTLLIEAEPNESVTLVRFNLTVHTPQRPGVYYVNVTHGNLTFHIPVVVGRKARVVLTNVSRSHDLLVLKGRVEGVPKDTIGSIAIVLNGKTVKKVPLVRGRFSATIDLVRADMSGGSYELYAIFYAPGYLPSKSRPVKVRVMSQPSIRVYMPYYVRAGSVELRGEVLDGGGKPVSGRVEAYVDGRYVGACETNGSGRFSIPLNLKPGVHTIEVRFTGSNYVTPGRVSLTVDAIGVIGIRAKKEKDGVVIYGTIRGTDSIDVVTSMGTISVPGGDLRIVLKSKQPLMQVLLMKGNTVLWQGSFVLRRIEQPPAPPGKISAGGVTVHSKTKTTGTKTKTETGTKTGKTKTESSSSRTGTSRSWAVNLRIVAILALLTALSLVLRSLPERKTAAEKKGSEAKIWMERDVFATGEEVVIRTDGDGPVFVDGKEVGRGPEVVIKAIPGVHRVEFRGVSRTFRVLPPEEAVVELYSKFVAGLSSMGVRTVSLTPAEIERELRVKLPQRGETLRFVTRVFETVRYGGRRVSMPEFKRFIDSIREVEEALGRNVTWRAG
ncbi:MAG: DUF4129 domain-containing protein [Thermococci archaeon]|nr:DUF4129 domain-containing protein [Thermococci archaeon]